VPAALGFGVLKGIKLFGPGILESMDRVASSVILPVGGLIIAMFVGWKWSRTDAFRTAGLQDGVVARAWLLLLRFVAPCLIVLILAGLVTA
jgi:NSS family neurotransmitter:Na+ symporter